MTALQKMKRALAIAKKASAPVKDPDLREIAREMIYLHVLRNP